MVGHRNQTTEVSDVALECAALRTQLGLSSPTGKGGIYPAVTCRDTTMLHFGMRAAVSRQGLRISAHRQRHAHVKRRR